MCCKLSISQSKLFYPFFILQMCCSLLYYARPDMLLLVLIYVQLQSRLRKETIVQKQTQASFINCKMTMMITFLGF